MNEGSGIPRRTIDRRTATRAGIAIGVVVILAALLGPPLLTTHPPTALSTQRPSGTPRATSPVTTPGATEEPWVNLGPMPYAPTAELTPLDLDRVGAAPGTAFLLRSFTDTPAVELAARLVANPPVALAVKPGATPDLAVIQPVKPLSPLARYRFRLQSADGVLVGSWIYITRGPLHVTGTLPGDQAVAVPTNTGIEVTFDQDQTTGVPQRFSIDPKVAGRFEQHQRTWSFVPDKTLAAATIYTVTLAKGVSITGSDGVLEAPVTFRFETAAPGPAFANASLGLSMLEVRPNEQPVLAIYGDEENGVLPASIKVKVHRLPDFKALLDAAGRLLGRDGWAIAATTAVVDTSGMTQVATVDGVVITSTIGDALRVPVKLAAGAYILTLDQPGPPVQLILQVTDLSAYAQVATSSTVVWVNELATDTAIGGATVSVAGGSTLGTTGADGLLQAPTPDALVRPTRTDDAWSYSAASFLTIAAPDGRRLLMPIGMPVSEEYGGYDGYGGAGSDWFVAYDSERTTFRRVDVAHVFGVVRARSDRSVPDKVDIVLHPIESETDAAILRLSVTPTARGVFTADVPIDNLPFGSYQIELLVAGTALSSLWIDVTEIRKPAYQIDVQTDRHVYLAGDSAKVTAVATFFDGTAVPGVDLVTEGFEQTFPTTTGEHGESTVTIPDRSSYGPEGWSAQSMVARPAGAEEGDISGEAQVTVFPSRSWLAAGGTLTDGRIVVDGLLSQVDFAGVEATLAAGYWIEDPAGAPIPGGTVKAQVIHFVPVRTQIGSEYDFIEKMVTPVYDYHTNDVTIANLTLTAGADGRFHLSIPAPVLEDSYEIDLTTKDAQGRLAQATVYVAAPYSQSSTGGPYIGDSNQRGGSYLQVGLHQAVEATIHEGDGSVASGGRFLFLVGKPGSVDVTLQDAATFVRTFHEADVPGFVVQGVWLSSAGYFASQVQVAVDPKDKTLQVVLVPDRERYAPGDRVTVKVTTTDAAGLPVSADVIVQGVDEKLYRLGYAADVNPLPELLSLPSSGFLAAYRSHVVPQSFGGGCGAEGGVGRDDFRDQVTFQRIATDAEGNGLATFELSDDLTSWRINAVAVSDNLDAGFGSVNIPVGLPFFVDATLAPEYLVGEDVQLRVRAFGDALSSSSAVRFTVSSPTLNLPGTTVSGTGFASVHVPLPTMTAGDHDIRIEGTVTIGGKTYRDALIRSIHVTGTRLTSLAASYELMDASFTPHRGGEGLTRFIVTDDGRGRFIGQIERLSWSSSGRFDSATAAELARRLLVSVYGVPADSFDQVTYDVARYEQRGIALLPYASVDGFLSARAALLAPAIVDSAELRDALDEWASSGGRSTGEQQVAALAGLAGLGVDVLDRLYTFDPNTLTLREQLWLALGLAAAGDEAAARTIESAVLASNGQRLGPWVRLKAGTTKTDTLEASGLLLMLAVAVHDTIADDVSRYLTDHPSGEVIFPLEQIAYLQSAIDRRPRAPGRFAWTVNGDRHVVTLPPGGAYTLVLTEHQVADLSFERLTGKLAVATSWTTAGATLPSEGGLTLIRSVTPAGTASEGQLVRVIIEVNFGSLPVQGCYRLTELVPSGLAPVSGYQSWADGLGPDVNRPDRIDGQIVSWCAGPSTSNDPYGYVARVVSPGTYLWEPTVIQSEIAPTEGTSIPATIYTIR